MINYYFKNVYSIVKKYKLIMQQTLVRKDMEFNVVCQLKGNMKLGVDV